MDTRSVSSSTSLAAYSQSQLQNRQLRSAEGVQTPSVTTPVQNTTSLNTPKTVNNVNGVDNANGLRSVERSSSVSQSVPLASPTEPKDINAVEKAAEKELEKQQDAVEFKQVQELSQRDREVRSHEAAHAAAGGQYTGAPSYTYTRGPDGKLYATEGQVSIDTSAVPNDPEATIAKAETVIRSALAPANPSPQDIKVAAQAQAMLVTAQAELALKVREEQSVEKEQTESSEEESTEDVFEVRGVDKEKIRENTEGIESRLDRSREQQELFADQLQELNRRVGEVLQQVIDTGATEGLTTQGTFIDITA